MKQIYTFLLCMIGLASFAAAQTVPSPDYFKKHIQANAQKAVNQRDGLPLLSWEQFKENVQKEIAYAKTLNSTRLPITEHLRFVKDAKTQPPDWAEMVGSEKFLFLGETISGAPATLQAVQSALHALREQFPGKHILLATEFVQNTRPNMPALRKAGQTSELLEKYPLFATADAENVDILALDDHIFAVENGIPVVKVGAEYIQFYTLPQGKQEAVVNTILGKSSEEMNFLLLMEKLIKSSAYGLVKNNVQWAKRILPLQNDYDLIVVYTTTQHLLTERTALANYLKAPTAPTVILAPSAAQVTPDDQKLHLELLWLLNDLQFGEGQRDLQKKAAQAQNQQQQNILSYQLLRLQNNEIDLYTNANLLRSFHAQEATLRQDVSSLVPNEEATLNIFTHPFCVELYPSSFVISWLYSQLTPQQQQENQSLLLRAAHNDTEEGRIFFYHVGNAMPTEFGSQQNGSSTTK